MRKRIELEYIFSSSVKVLYSRLSTPAGLAEWFADDVITEQSATLVEAKPYSRVRFVWDDAEDEDEYFEFEIHVEPLTGDVALIITDFVDEDEESDSVSVWDKQIESLHRNLGA